MYARAVDDAASRLRQLQGEERGDLALAALALGLAVAATQVRPELAVPLFLGGLGVGVFGIRALWRRWDLLDRLAGERDAYVISEVRAFASREATLERRRSCAASIRRRLEEPRETRIALAADDLGALAAELDDPDLEIDLACAVACVRLVSDVAGSPLLNPSLPPGELRARVRRIRSGFETRKVAA
jgi:hypothetical protein